MWLLLFDVISAFLSVVICIAMSILLYYKYAFSYWKRKGVAYPEPRFPFGNVTKKFSLTVGSTFAQIYSDMKKTGATYCGFYIFSIPIFMPISPEMIKNILIKYHHQHFNNRGFVCDEKNDPMGLNVSTASGELWKNLREKFNRILTPGRMKMMFPYVSTCTKQLEELIENACRRKEPLDITDVLKRYTVDVICLCGFGLEGNSLKDPESVPLQKAKALFKFSIINSLRLAIGINAPSISNFFKIQLFDPSVSEFFRKVVKETIRYRIQNNVQRDDFVNLLITSRNSNNAGNNLNDMTDDQIAAQCLVFFIGGFETTSSLLMASLYKLAVNCDIQDKVRDEILSTLEKSGGELHLDVVKKMQYLDNVLSETLRMYPIIVSINRVCTEDFQIPESNVVIKKGTKIVISPVGLHYDPELFENPEKFDPDRFTEERKAKIHPQTYVPFGDGPRICPGIKFAHMLAKLALITILRKYRIQIHPSVKLPVEFYSSITIGPKWPILLSFEEFK